MKLGAAECTFRALSPPIDPASRLRPALRAFLRVLSVASVGLAVSRSAVADTAARAPAASSPVAPVAQPAAAKPAATKQASYVARKPAPATQVQTSIADRGINPCMTPDPGFGVYGKWEGGIGMGQFIMPVHGGLTPRGDFDLMVHFHGHEPIRNGDQFGIGRMPPK